MKDQLEARGLGTPHPLDVFESRRTDLNRDVDALRALPRILGADITDVPTRVAMLEGLVGQLIAMINVGAQVVGDHERAIDELQNRPVVVLDPSGQASDAPRTVDLPSIVNDTAIDVFIDNFHSFTVGNNKHRLAQMLRDHGVSVIGTY